MMEKNPQIVAGLVDKYNTLKSARCNFENLWQDVVDLICPDRADFTVQTTAGAKRRRRLFDSIGVESAQFLAASLNGMMTDPAAKWFGLKFAGSAPVPTAWKEWLNQSVELFWSELYAPPANFAASVNETYMDDVALGTSLLFTGWDEKRNGLLFQSRTVAECVIDENANGTVDCVFRKFALSARQIKQAFPDYASDEIETALKDTKSAKKFVILHCVMPNDSIKGRFSLPFKGSYILLEKHVVLKEEMYGEFPFACARWSKLSGELYGRSPGMAALPELQMLQDVKKAYVKSAQKAAEPPIMLQNEETFIKNATEANGVIRYDQTPPQAFVSGANFQVSESLIDRDELKVRKTFMNDRLADVLGDRATATEVIQIVRENARVLGPIYWRQTSEKLNPVLTRAFNLCYRHGKFPPFPGDANGIGIDIEYLSPMAQAMKYEKADRINQAFQASAAFIQADPQSIALLDAQKAVRQIYSIYGVDDLLRSPDDVAAILNQQAQAAAQQQATAQAGDALALQAMQNQVQAQDMELNQDV